MGRIGDPGGDGGGDESSDESEVPSRNDLGSFPTEKKGFGFGDGPPDGSSPGGSNSGLNVSSSPFVGDEDSVYKAKDLAHVSISSLPKNASAFRGWRNSLIAKLSSIDRTGQGVIMRWVQGAFLPSSPQILQHLESRSDGLPRLDAWLAGQLSEPKHMSGEIGMRFQSYLERAQLTSSSLHGRRMLHEGRLLWIGCVGLISHNRLC